MKNLFKKLVAFLFIVTLVTSCSHNESALDDLVQQKYAALDNLFSAYTVVKIDKDKLLDYSKQNHDQQFQLDLQIPEKPNWVFNVEFHDFFKGEYKAFETDADGNWVEVIRNDRSDAYHGQSSDLESRAMFIMEDHLFTGNIYEGDEEYFMEPLDRFVEGVSADLYVYYNADADIAGKNSTCGNTDEDFVPGENDLGNTAMDRANCREMSITYVADYQYRGKFSNNSTSTRNYIENRLRYGSYRYWGYNGYPLYFWLYRSYVRTTTSNAPTTSTNSSTALSQWRTWARANVSNGDSNLLYTGRDFGTLFGRAYVGTVCKYTSAGQRRAYGLVTKNSGISASTYNKVTAHEVGHNLGCSHQTTGFMKQGNHNNTTMASGTVSELNSYISSNNGCMPLRTCVSYR